MSYLLFHKISKRSQYFISIGLISIICGLCYFLPNYIDYKVVAFLLLTGVSIIAMFFDILPVLLAAILSALFWDYFFIPPRFTFHVGSAEDTFMLMMYFVIALVNAVFTYKIRQIEKEARLKEEKANTVKLYNTLLNSLSHELRTPIATIIGATDNLLNNNERLTKENKEELLEDISTASLRLNRQVENLLNMSRLESGFIQVRKDWCDVNELIYTVLNHLEEPLKAHTVVVNTKDNIPLFKLDRGLMEQVLYNIIHNATIYTPANSTITIHVDCINDACMIRISDNGKGFPLAELERAFDKFYRIKNSQTGGIGLGLSIVKGFVEAHNGTIELQNINTGGALFIISIPTETSYLNNLKNE